MPKRKPSEPDAKEKPVMGRPTGYNLKVTSEILSRIAHGESLKAICRSVDMPVASTVWLWLSTHKDFSDQYARACEERAEAIFEETIEIADNSAGDITITEDGTEIVNHENIQRARLRVDTRKWFVSKLFPKKYSDKQQVEHSGSITTLSSLVEASMSQSDAVPASKTSVH